MAFELTYLDETEFYTTPIHGFEISDVRIPEKDSAYKHRCAYDKERKIIFLHLNSYDMHEMRDGIYYSMLLIGNNPVIFIMGSESKFCITEYTERVGFDYITTIASEALSVLSEGKSVFNFDAKYLDATRHNELIDKNLKDLKQRKPLRKEFPFIERLINSPILGFLLVIYTFFIAENLSRYVQLALEISVIVLFYKPISLLGRHQNIIDWLLGKKAYASTVHAIGKIIGESLHRAEPDYFEGIAAYVTIKPDSNVVLIKLKNKTERTFSKLCIESNHVLDMVAPRLKLMCRSGRDIKVLNSIDKDSIDYRIKIDSILPNQEVTIERNLIGQCKPMNAIVTVVFNESIFWRNKEKRRSIFSECLIKE